MSAWAVQVFVKGAWATRAVARTRAKARRLREMFPHLKARVIRGEEKILAACEKRCAPAHEALMKKLAAPW